MFVKRKLRVFIIALTCMIVLLLAFEMKSRMVNELSARYKQETAVCIEGRQPAAIAGIKGFSETYLYRVKENATSTFTFTMFKKNQFGYLIIMSTAGKRRLIS